uniref:Uncharacterized protein n=1 Tax=Arundo donax TaxID=35708 RepID=A0A0A9CDL6_ARUDO
MFIILIGLLAELRFGSASL